MFQTQQKPSHGPTILLWLQVTNPLYLWQLWRSDARYARQCFARHDSMMNDKVAALLKLPPPEYTIAGTCVGILQLGRDVGTDVSVGVLGVHVDTFATVASMAPWHRWHQWHCLLGLYRLKP